MQNITVNTLFTDLVPLPTISYDAVLTLTIRKASGGTLTGGTFAFLAGIQWKLTFTPATLYEVYAVEVLDTDSNVVFSQSYKALGSIYDATTGPTGILAAGTNTWATGQEAEDYFATRFGVGTNWSALTDANKIAALISAYRQLVNLDDYDFPSTIDQEMKDAQCEMALFLIIHQADMDARMGLQAQGVTQAGIVQESYDKDAAGRLAVPAIVRNMLSEYESESPLLAADVERDDDKSA